MSRQQRRHTTPKRINWILWGSLAAVIILGVAGYMIAKSPAETGVNYAQYTFTDDAFAKPEATKVLEEFSDFQCPACQMTSPQVKALRDAAPADVRVVYRHFPLTSIHPLAQGAAEAAECAREQNRFWAYHDVLFDSKRIEPRALSAHAIGLGLDTNKWQACMDEGRSKPVVQRDVLEGRQRNVEGTPTFFANGMVYKGSRTVSDFLAAVNG